MTQIYDARGQISGETSRQCGTCYTCCVHLGINELQKHPGQTCKHLNGTVPDKRCFIYASRPKACVRYSCGWLEGLGNDNARPDKSGLLITAYPSESLPFPSFTTTIMITDETKCGTLKEGFLNEAISRLLEIHCEQIRIVNYKTKKIFYFKDNKIFMGILHPTKNFEELIFEIRETPIGTYESQERFQFPTLS